MNRNDRLSVRATDNSSLMILVSKESQIWWFTMSFTDVRNKFLKKIEIEMKLEDIKEVACVKVLANCRYIFSEAFLRSLDMVFWILEDSRKSKNIKLLLLVKNSLF